MSGLSLIIAQFEADESGATAIEYGLMAGLIAMGLIMAITTLSGGVTGLYEYILGEAGPAMGG